MDPITHGLLGAVTAQLGFRQKTGRDATWVAAATAMLPDLDLFLSPLLAMTGAEVGGPDNVLGHRGLSHSILFAPLLALPVAALWWKLRQPKREPEPESADSTSFQPRSAKKSPPFWLLYLCVFVAAVVHPLLDWCTSYGTQIFAPLSNRRYALDAIPIIDIIYTLLLALTLVGCYIVRKLHGGRSPRASLIIGWAGMLLGIGYIAAGRVMHDRAIDKAASVVEPAAHGEKVLNADAYPAIGSIFLWRAVIETDKGWHAVRVHMFSDAPPSRFAHQFAPKTPPNEWIEKAMQTDKYREYEWFADGHVRVEYHEVGGMHVVVFNDMRYGHPLDSVNSHWPLVAQFDTNGELLSIERRSFLDERKRGDMKNRAVQAWNDMWNP